MKARIFYSYWNFTLYVFGTYPLPLQLSKKQSNHTEIPNAHFICLYCTVFFKITTIKMNYFFLIKVIISNMFSTCNVNAFYEFKISYLLFYFT